MLCKGDQCETEREGGQVPWSWEGRERVEELRVCDAVNEGPEYQHENQQADL